MSNIIHSFSPLEWIANSASGHSRALFFLDHTQNVLPYGAPHRIKDEYACYNQSAPYPMRAFKIEPDKGANHDGIKGEGVEQAPHCGERSLHYSSSCPKSLGNIKSTIRQEAGSSQSPSDLSVRFKTVQAPVG